jgi:hypothetical protein
MKGAEKLRMKRHKLISTLHVLISMALAIGLVVLGASAAGRYRWPFLHGWALIHGTFFFIYPIYCLFFFLLLRPLVNKAFPRPETAAEIGNRLSWIAVSSLILSAAGWLIPLLASIVGIVLGHLGLSRCKANAKLCGKGIALTGLVIGYTGLAYQIYVIATVWMVARL